MKTNNFSCHDASDVVVREDVMSLSKLGSRELGTFNHRFVVSKHIGLLVDRYTQISKIVSKFYNLLKTCPSCNELSAVCSTLNGRRFLGISFHWESIEVVDDTRH